MSSSDIVFANVSKFYGEVLGVNHVNLVIQPGITSLVGPNGSGKSTLMNLMTGLLRPTSGRCTVLGLTASEPERLFRLVGYATQYDAFPHGLTGRSFLTSFLRLHGYDRPVAARLAGEAIERVGLTGAADRRVGGYSKGMRQRIKLAHAIAHRPAVLVLDEPLNGLDPMARAEVGDLFQQLAEEGLHVIISSHILHEVDTLSDRVLMINSGYVVAEGDIEGVRTEMKEHPAQVLVRCRQPERLAAELFRQDHIVAVEIHEDRQGLNARTRDADRFHLVLNRIFLDEGLEVEAVRPIDENVEAIYGYLIGGDGGSL